MKKKLLIACLLLSGFFTPIFSQEKCATMHVFNEHLKENPELWSKLHPQQADRWATSNGTTNFYVNGRLLTLPVVFHVIYYEGDSAKQNVPDSVLISQLEVLNEDYRRMNADTINTRDIFKPMAADIGIEFVLATVDPDGNPTNGITRTKTTTDGFNPLTGFDKMKASATGGVDPWPADKYFNIWICDMSFFGQVFVLGYAQFPGDNPLTDGVVFQYQHVGRNNNLATAPANKGRTASHEVGHWLGLRHIWGDGPCDSTDYVYDTPSAADKSQSDCNKNKNTCTDFPYDYPDMVENYMDYSADACMNTFTKGQAQRMWSMINLHRTGLLSSDKHGGSYINILPSIKGVTCPNSCDGEISFTAYGGVPPYSYLWSNNDTTNSISGLCEGEYTLTVTDSLNNSNTVTFVLTTPEELAAQISSTNSSCDTCATGTLTASATNIKGNATYSWNTNPVQNTEAATNLLPGSYTVTIMDVCDTIVLTDSVKANPTSINHISISDNMRIFPNPTTEKLSIEFTIPTNAVEIRVYNPMGQIIKSTFEKQSTNSIYSLDLSENKSGLYIIEIKAGNDIIRKKITITK